VLLEEVDADAEGVRRLALREREATERGADRLLTPVIARDDLYAWAKRLDIPQRSRMRKSELAEAVAARAARR
jgi:hypothetical protein